MTLRIFYSSENCICIHKPTKLNPNIFTVQSCTHTRPRSLTPTVLQPLRTIYTKLNPNFYSSELYTHKPTKLNPNKFTAQRCTVYTHKLTKLNPNNFTAQRCTVYTHKLTKLNPNNFIAQRCTVYTHKLTKLNPNSFTAQSYIHTQDHEALYLESIKGRKNNNS